LSENDGILFYSDFNCPFCYALNERLVALGDSTRIRWRGIEHEASATSRVVTLDEKNQLLNEVSVVRKRAPEISVVTPPFRPNTNLVNRVVFAMLDQDSRKMSELRTLIYRALWLHGKDISNPDFLKKLVEDLALDYPADDQLEVMPKALEQWQTEWQSEVYQTRLPVLVSTENNKPILGFPTYDLLHYFFNGTDLPVAPDSFAACQLKPKQNILMVGEFQLSRCNMVELEPAYYVIRKRTLESAQKWLNEQDCSPDMVLINYDSFGNDGLLFCNHLKKQHEYRHLSLLFLMAQDKEGSEMAAFDAGATDVVFDLSNPKVCQARLDAQLRAKQSATILDALARLDYLTELPNRREFDRRFDEDWLRSLRSGKPLSIILIDIDHFKFYNDHYGHTLGDDCLRQTTKAMSNAIHRTSDIVARYGGEEFVVLLPETDTEGATTVAEALRASVEMMQVPHLKSLVSEFVTISVGVASIVPDLGILPHRLLEAADEALYESKENGRNQVTVNAGAFIE